MKEIFRAFIVCCIIFGCCGSAVHADKPRTSTDFDLKLKVLERQIHQGAVPEFQLTYTNKSERPQRILDAEKRHDLQITYYHLVILQNGKRVEVPITISDPGPIRDEDWITIPVGKSKTFVYSGYPEAYGKLPLGAYQAHVEFLRDPFEKSQSITRSETANFLVTK